MARRAQISQYFADDKDVFDLLKANQRLTVPKLVEHARKRGLLLSAAPGTDRDELIKHMSRMGFDWLQLLEIVEMTDSTERREKMASVELGTAKAEDLERAARGVDKARSKLHDEKYEITNVGNVVKISVTYSELDPNKSRLAQRTMKTAEVEFETTPQRTLVRRHANERADEILDAIVAAMEAQSTPMGEPKKIEMSQTRDPAARTKFFVDLMTGIDGMKLDTVKAVKVNRLDEEDDDDEEDEQVDPSVVGVSPTKSKVAAYVEKVALHGDKVQDSEEYKRLVADGFFVGAVTFVVTETKVNGKQVEYEAGFEKTKDAKGFAYAVRGLYEARSNGQGFLKTKATVKSAEARPYMRLLEESAVKALATATASVTVDVAQLQMAADAAAKATK